MKLFRTITYYSKRYANYHISTYAASASFFVITAIFPVLMLTLSILSFTPLGTQDFIMLVSDALPESFQPLFEYVFSAILTSSATALSVSLVATLWSASKCMLGLVDGLNAIADVNDTRNFILKRIVCIGYMLVFILGLLVTLGLRVFGLHIYNKLLGSFPSVARMFSVLLRFRGLTLFLVIAFIMLLLYTFFPNKKMRIFMQIPGALFSSFAWIVFSEVFSIYVDNFSSFSVLYGGLGLAVMAMLWLYFCLCIVFIGAVLNRVYPSVFWRTLVVLKYRRSLKREAQTRKDAGQ